MDSTSSRDIDAEIVHCFSFSRDKHDTYLTQTMCYLRATLTNFITLSNFNLTECMLINVKSKCKIHDEELDLFQLTIRKPAIMLFRVKLFLLYLLYLVHHREVSGRSYYKRYTHKNFLLCTKKNHYCAKYLPNFFHKTKKNLPRIFTFF